MKDKLLISIRRRLLLFMILLGLSGLTALPVELQLNTALSLVSSGSRLHDWLREILHAYQTVQIQYPFLLYGYDWLAFAHIVLALFFIGPYRDPVRNIWVVQCGLIACGLVFPTAFLAGPLRGIPFWWQLIDCSFGFFGFLLLWSVARSIHRFTLQKQLAV